DVRNMQNIASHLLFRQQRGLISHHDLCHGLSGFLTEVEQLPAGGKRMRNGIVLRYGFVGIDDIQGTDESAAYRNIALGKNRQALPVESREAHAIGMFHHGAYAIAEGLVGVEPYWPDSPQPQFL